MLAAAMAQMEGNRVLERGTGRISRSKIKLWSHHKRPLDQYRTQRHMCVLQPGGVVSLCPASNGKRTTDLLRRVCWKRTDLHPGFRPVNPKFEY